MSLFYKKNHSGRYIKFMTFNTRNKRSIMIIILISIGFGVVFGLLDSIVSSLVFKKGDVLSQIFINDANVLWKRSLVIFIFIIGGFIVIRVLKYIQTVDTSLYESQEKFKNVFSFSGAGMVVADLNGNFIEVNPAIVALLGYSQSELLKKNFRSITHPEDLEEDIENLNRLNKGDINKFSMEKRYLHKNGNYIWIYLTASVVRDSNSRPLYYIGHIQNLSDKNESSFIDLTHREKAIFEKNRSSQEINQIFNSIGIGMCLIDSNYKIARVNSTYLKIFRKREDEVIGHSCYDTMPCDLCHSSECPLTRILNGSDSYEFEVRKEIDDHTLLTFITTANPFYSPDGKIQGIIEGFTDISEIKKLENKIAEIADEERQNLGQILHDDIGQILTGVNFRIEALKRSLNVKSQPEAADANEIGILVKEIQSQIRKIMVDLYCPDITYDRLPLEIQKLCEETKKLFNVKCTINSSTEEFYMDNSSIIQLLYIAKESIHNAIKHAGAKQITISLDNSSNDFIMEITSDGEIKENLNFESKGFGMKIMEYRAKKIGAKFEPYIKDGRLAVRVKKSANNI